MPVSGDIFEPDFIRNVLKNLQGSVSERKLFEKEWNQKVQHRVESWKKNRENQSKHTIQLQWEAAVVEYVNYIHRATTIHGNAGSRTVSPPLKKDIPLLGPRFLPPTYYHLAKREVEPDILPNTAYVKPLTVIHPVYYSVLGLTRCPQCESTDVLWDGWTATGACEVHGLHREEQALGYQLRCKPCQAKYGKGGSNEKEKKSCFATTNKFFWEKWEHWKIPRTIPYFMSRSAVTHELFDLVTEIRPSTTSAGLEKHIKQLHLLEYHQQMLEFLTVFAARKQNIFKPLALQKFSGWDNPDGYNDSCITHDMITDIYLEFVKKTRQGESSSYCKTRTGIALSLDNTFKSAGKAVVIDTNKARVKLMKGGILSVINELNEILAWRFCQSQSPAEIRELLEQYIERCKALGIPLPEILVADNCCQIRRSVTDAIPTIQIVLDVYHFMMRYLGTVSNGTKNPHRGEVAQDIRDAILESGSGKGCLAKYWPKEEQERRLCAAYEKWSLKGSVWSPGAPKVHADQLAHVKKGCLARHRQDIASDGSRIEGSHKGWNSLQRAQPSGIEMYAALAHDFVLRRNIRVFLSHQEQRKQPSSTDLLIKFSFGCHHVNLIKHLAISFNSLLDRQPQSVKNTLSLLPTFQDVKTNEIFGLVPSEHTKSFGGLLVVKEELEDTDDPILQELSRRTLDQDHDEERSTQSDIDPSLLSIAAQPSCSEDGHLQVASSGVGSGMGSDSKRKVSPIALEGNSPEPPRKRVCIANSEQLLNDLESSPEVDEVIDLDCALPDVVDATESTEQGFFKFKKPCLLPTQVPATSANVSISSLNTRLPLPSHLQLTRSEIVFSAGTATNPRSLVVERGEEFFLFMDMRATHQWSSFTMNSQKWVAASKLFNEALAKVRKAKGLPEAIKKNPRALIDKLAEIEPKIAKRLATNDFVSCQSKTDQFWQKHCHAVSLVKSETSVSNILPADAAGKLVRKVAACSRCKTIMYPGPTGSAENHKKGYCSDGVRQKVKVDSNDGPLPDWPQPAGIFTSGTHFHPLPFLSMIRQLYDKVVDGAITEGEYSMEDEAFSRLLASRIRIEAGQSLFRLYDLEIPAGQVSASSSLLVEIDSTKYLRIGCLEST